MLYWLATLQKSKQVGLSYKFGKHRKIYRYNAGNEMPTLTQQKFYVTNVCKEFQTNGSYVAQNLIQQDERVLASYEKKSYR